MSAISIESLTFKDFVSKGQPTRLDTYAHFRNTIDTIMEKCIIDPRHTSASEGAVVLAAVGGGAVGGGAMGSLWCDPVYHSTTPHRPTPNGPTTRAPQPTPCCPTP